MNNVHINENENTMTVIIEMEIPVKREENSNETYEEFRERMKGRYMDIIGSFSKRLIESLKRRMSAYQQNLINHASDAYSPEPGRIEWRRKDGTKGYYDKYEFGTMKDCLKCLTQGDYGALLYTPAFMGQLIEALMNDPKEYQDHSDAGVFKYSELVTVLRDCHTPIF